MKKLLLVCLSLIVITAALTAFFVLPASAETYNGTCGTQGNNLTWTLDTETGVLTISGTGEMENFGTAPWYNYSSNIFTVIIADGVTSVGASAFDGCSSLTDIILPNSITSIGGEAFQYCSSLTSITIPNSVTSIGSFVFFGCSSLTSITIPNSVTSIGNYAFRFCSSLTSITIPNSVTSIGGGAFQGCSSLKSITIPNSVTSIGDLAFEGCSSLKTVYNCSSLDIVKGMTNYGYVAYYANSVYHHVPGSPATCTTAQTCTFCSATLAPALGHQSIISTGEPYCDDPGFVEEYCTVCEEVLHYEEIPALGHKPSEIADCSRDQICTVCQILLMPAFGHVPKERVDCKSPEVCSVCDMVLSEEPRHVFVTYAPVQPTFFESAIYNYGECQFCGEYMTRPPEILPSYFEQYFYVILSSSILLVVLLVVVPIVAASRRKKKKALLRAAEFGHWESKSRR